MTTEEIVRALRCCAEGECGGCAMHADTQRCQERVLSQAATTIEHLAAENADLRKGTKMKRSQKQAYEKTIKSLQALAGRQLSEIKKLQDDLRWKNLLDEYVLDTQERAEKAEAERDALLDLMKAHRACYACNADVVDCMLCTEVACPCVGCRDSSRWEWRGLPKAPEEGEKTDA